MKKFTEIIKEKNYALEHAALLLSREVEYRNLEIADYLRVLDELARTVELRMHPRDSVSDQISRLSEFLFEEEGFYGNAENYYDPRNSFLNDVLTRFTGIPITLSIVYMAVASRIGLAMYGVGLPGHFVVACHDDSHVVYVDPFHEGIILEEAECVTIAKSHLPPGMSFSRAFLSPQPNRLILKRVLTNLRHIYLKQNDTERLLRVLVLEHSLTPEDIELSRDIGVLQAHREQWGAAARSLREYLFQRPHAPDIETIRMVLNDSIENLSKLN